MAKANIWQWDENAANNTELDGISLAENVMVPSDVNNALREMMSQVITTEGKGTAIASAATLTLSGPERYFHITGSTGPITDIDFTDAVDGRWAWLIFDSTPTLTHNATTLILPGAASIVAAAGDCALFVQDSSDNVICLVYQRAAARPADQTGTYTPTLTNSTNVASSTATVCQYMRVGDFVMVSGSVRVTATAAAGAETILLMSLPVASDFSGSTQLGGTGAPNSVTGAMFNEAWGIYGASATNEATFICAAQTTADHSVSFSFMYQVIV
jgi:hypothetical protein